ncbi:hypothetical protein GXP67_05425 [Rhodocytophaga rosea]|uniref:Methane oxygenase PmoA n=2 Tax=Rhodocytophaga rosea TaxID=2704465 RepID=A0A6C0GVS6_9BACT|nr:hypothetical protein GXP67_05425 [Rhodocytophaga rosea]
MEPVKLVHDEQQQRVDITIGGKPFTSYIYPTTIKKPVLYPVLTSSGTAITRGFPLEPRAGERIDHPHHVGLWFNYGDVNGLDFWNNSDSIAPEKKDGYGTIQHKKVNKVSSGKDKGELDVTMDWITPDSTPLLREDTKFVFSGDINTRIIDRITTLTALDKEVLFRDNKEGMIGLRVARQLEQPSNKPELFTDASGKVTNVPRMDNEGVSGLYRSSEGTEGDAVWGTRGQWVNLAGSMGSEPISITMMDHPKNVGHPTYWHARGYGLFAANNLGQKALSDGKEELNFKLMPSKSVTFRHRVLIRSGEPLTNEQLKAAYQKFAER